MPHDVFISYAHQDQQVADLICQTLEARGIPCWIAPRDINPGQSFAEAIVAAMRSSKVMVLVFTSSANRSRHVVREAELAVENAVDIMPLRIEDAVPSDALKYFISSHQWMDAYPLPLEEYVNRLGDAIRSHIGAPGQAPVAAATPNPSPEARTSGHRELSHKAYVTSSLAALVLVVVLKIIIEGIFPQVESFRTWVYGEMQHMLVPDERQIPIVVDVSDFRDDTSGVDSGPTPRYNLDALIQEILKHKPTAIGVDVDMSPDPNGPITANGIRYITKGDPVFFDACLRYQAKTDVRFALGIARSIASRPGEWLGELKYQSLAANIYVPKTGGRVMPLWIRLSQNGTTAEGGDTYCRSLAAALANITDLPTDHAWLTRRLEEIPVAQGLSFGAFPVDYSPLTRLKSDYTVRTIDPHVIEQRGEIFTGRAVIIGFAASPDKDLQDVPGQQERVPGVYLHACAEYTLGKRPLYQFTQSGRVLVDLTMWVTALIVILVVLPYRDGISRPTLEARRKWVTTAVLVGCTIIAQFIMARRDHILWDDFALVILYVPIHHGVHEFVRWLYEYLPGRPGPKIAASARGGLSGKTKNGNENAISGGERNGADSDGPRVVPKPDEEVEK